MDPTRILFVCAGNICRSPLAEGIFRHLATLAGHAGSYNIDSAGTGGWHEGQRPDPRSIAVAMHHGIDISGQRARKIRTGDFHHFHVILAMDRDNLRNLATVAPPGSERLIHLFSHFATGRTEDVPDPYYGDREGFEAVYSQLLAGCSTMLARLEADRFS